MIGWRNTRHALGKLEKLLTCKVCASLVSDPCSLEACDHVFCRTCIEKLVGADSKCPECGAFAWVKDMKTNRQLANTVSMCAKMRMLVGSDNNEHGDADNIENTNTPTNNVSNKVWEETRVVLVQETDSYQFSSPEVITCMTAQPLSKCDAATPEISCNNKRTSREPLFKVYSKAKMRTSAKGKGIGVNKADNGVVSFCDDKQGVHGNLPEKDTREGGKILVCQNGKLLKRGGDLSEKGVVEDSRNSRTSKRIEVKEKCFGKQLKTRRVKKTVSSVVNVSPCSDQEGGRKDQTDHQSIENTDNLQFGAQEEDGSFMDTEEATGGDSFTRVKSKGEKDQVEGTLQEAEDENGIPKTRAQKRKQKGTETVSSSNVLQPRQAKAVSSDTSKGMLSSKKKKVTKNSTETPVKQGNNKNKISSQHFSSPQNSTFSSPGAKRNKRGETPLHVAAIKGCVETVRKLLAEGADPNTKDHAGWTPLHEACNHGYQAIAELLLDHGAMIDIPGGFDHDTPLHDAVTNGRLEVARLLVSKGAPLDIRNKRGQLPIDYAATDEMQTILSTSTPYDDSGSTSQITSLPLSGRGSHDYPKVLLATGLTSEQKAILQSCAQILDAKIVNEFSLLVTHIVTATNAKGVCPRTIKYLNGVLTGKWIVSYEWIVRSLRRKAWLDEDSYEVKGTNDATVDAPKRARVNAVKQLPGLFDGCQFYFYGEFCPPHPSKEDLIQMVKFGGGKVLSREPKPDVDETLCLPTSHKTSKVPSQAVMLAPVAYHANPESKQYRCTQYIIYDSLAQKKPHIWDTGSLCTLPLTWLMDCASNFAILDSE